MDASHAATTPSEFGKKYAKYAKCARWIIMQRGEEWRRATLEKYANRVCNVCRHGCSHTRTDSPPKAERTPQKMVSVRLRAAATCAAYLSYLA